MKLKLDENLADIGRYALEADGHDVSSVAEQGLIGTSDQNLYEVVRAEDRVLVTLDLDFASPLRFPVAQTPGIAVLRCQGPQTLVNLRQLMDELRRHLGTRPVAGQLWIVEPGRVRMRDA